jgi:hypothetical protein
MRMTPPTTAPAIAPELIFLWGAAAPDAAAVDAEEEPDPDPNEELELDPDLVDLSW